MKYKQCDATIRDGTVMLPLWGTEATYKDFVVFCGRDLATNSIEIIRSKAFLAAKGTGG